ncbi:MAG: transcriptional regulator, MarR family [Pseudonocardia sp.]|jgi:DNA-binding MarR family transcriptional regulator|nr:transcriptional regulator, MarR family [Pseudonocardia sp.]
MATDVKPATAERLSDELIRLKRLMERALATHHGQSGAEHDGGGLERAAFALLVHLVKGGPQRAGALAECVHCDPSTVSRQIQQLVRLGLIERRADPADGRASLLAATPEGEQVFERKRRWRNEHFAAMLADWSAADVDTLYGLLSRLNTDIENYRDRFTAEPVRS